MQPLIIISQGGWPPQWTLTFLAPWIGRDGRILYPSQLTDIRHEPLPVELCEELRMSQSLAFSGKRPRHLKHIRNHHTDLSQDGLQSRISLFMVTKHFIATHFNSPERHVIGGAQC